MLQEQKTSGAARCVQFGNANNNLEAAPARGGILGGPTLGHHPQLPAQLMTDSTATLQHIPSTHVDRQVFCLLLDLTTFRELTSPLQLLVTDDGSDGGGGGGVMATTSC